MQVFSGPEEKENGTFRLFFKAGNALLQQESRTFGSVLPVMEKLFERASDVRGDIRIIMERRKTDEICNQT